MRRHFLASPRLVVTTILAMLAVALPLAGSVATSAGATTSAPAAAGVTPQDVCNFIGSRPTIRPGGSGPAVRQLQCYLNHALDPARYPPLPIDGILGPATAARLRTFQHCVGLVVDGIVGPQTWAALEAAANSGSFLPC
jgi:lysozyme